MEIREMRRLLDDAREELASLKEEITRTKRKIDDCVDLVGYVEASLTLLDDMMDTKEGEK